MVKQTEYLLQSLIHLIWIRCKHRCDISTNQWKIIEILQHVGENDEFCWFQFINSISLIHWRGFYMQIMNTWLWILIEIIRMYKSMLTVTHLWSQRQHFEFLDKNESFRWSNSFYLNISVHFECVYFILFYVAVQIHKMDNLVLVLCSLTLIIKVPDNVSFDLKQHLHITLQSKTDSKSRKVNFSFLCVCVCLYAI